MSHPYEVLKRVESSSSPGKFYEIRKSHQDGKTYCSCPSWIFQARKGDGICKHIAAYMKEGFDVVVMNITEFLEVKRARLVLMPEKRMTKNIDVKRNLL